MKPNANCFFVVSQDINGVTVDNLDDFARELAGRCNG